MLAKNIYEKALRKLSLVGICYFAINHGESLQWQFYHLGGLVESPKNTMVADSSARPEGRPGCFMVKHTDGQ